MPEILITLSNGDCSDAEIQTVQELIENELDRCSTCKEIYTRTEHLPYHCNSCMTRRDERWLRFLVRRARCFVHTGALGHV